MFKITTLMLPLIFLSACSGGVSATTPTGGLPATAALPAKITLEAVPMILDPTRVPPAPDPAVNDSTVAGIDSNNNGIRDDIERWIAQTYPTSAKMRAAMAQMALNSQKEITTPNLTKDSVYQIALEGMDATHCAGDVRRSTGVGWDLKDYMSAMYNTRARFSALMAFQNTMGSRAFAVPENNTCSVTLSQLPD